MIIILQLVKIQGSQLLELNLSLDSILNLLSDICNYWTLFLYSKPPSDQCYCPHTGCRNALVNMEARPISSPMLTRRCILTRLADLTAERYRDIIEQSAGALLVLLPQNFSSLPQEVIQVHVYGLFVINMDSTFLKSIIFKSFLFHHF